MSDKCFICGKEIFGQFSVFSTGEKICKNHVQDFDSNFSKKEDIDLNLIKHKIISETLEEIVLLTSKECHEGLNYISCNNERINEIILEKKNKYDLLNQIDFEEIRAESDLFLQNFEEMIEEKILTVLDADKESFKFLHNNLIELIPQDEIMIDRMFQEDKYKITSYPFIAICRAIWSYYKKATSEKILNCVINCQSEYFKEKIFYNKKIYNYLLDELNKNGPLKEDEDILDNLFKILKSFND